MKAKHTIKTDADFLRKVDELVAMKTQIAMQKAEREAAVRQVLQQYAALDEMETNHDALHAALEAYMMKDGVSARLLPAGKKSGSTATATYGLRAGKPCLVLLEGQEEQAVIDRMKQNGMDEWLKFGKVSLNKSAIMGAGMSADELAEWGLEAKSKPSFFANPKGGK